MKAFSRIATVFLVSLAATIPAFSQAIPEPPLTLYGTVLNVQGTTNILWNFGTLTLRFQPASGGPAVTVSTTLSNINDQFCYVAEIPCESFAQGSTFSANVLRLSLTAGNSSVTYSRAAAVDGFAASLAPPASDSITVRPADRGRVERVDLRVTVPLIDCPPEDFDCVPNGLPDAWERHFFGVTGVNPQEDRDEDGVTNAEEFAAGTDPTNTDSFLRFVHVTQDPAGGVRVEWSSSLGKFYIVERSTELTTAFTPITANPVAATPPVNIYRDPEASGPVRYFYRIRLER